MRKDSKNSGYSITELIVVVAGIASLAALATPNVVRYVKEGQVDEAKALLNTAAAECLLQINQGRSLSEEIGKTTATPDSLKTGKSLPGNYQFTGKPKLKDGNPSCVNLELSDPSSKDSRLLTLRAGYDPETKRIEKSATWKHEDSKTACEKWGECIAGEEAAARAKKRAEEAARKAKLAECESKWTEFKRDKKSGPWTNACTGETRWAFEGRPVNDEDAFNKEMQAAKDQRKWKDFDAWVLAGNEGFYGKDGIDWYGYKKKKYSSEEEFKNAKCDFETNEGITNKQTKEILDCIEPTYVHAGKKYKIKQEWLNAIEASEAPPQPAPQPPGKNPTPPGVTPPPGKNPTPPADPLCIGGWKEIGAGKNKRRVPC